MKKLLVVLPFLIFNLVVIAQSSFGIKINGGVSKISDNSYNPQYESYKGYFKPSGQVGFFYNLPIRAHEVFGIELLFTQIESKEKIVDTAGSFITNYPNGKSTTLLSTYTISKHISYLSLPIHYGINVKKFTFNVGIQFSVRLLSSAQEIEQDNFSNNSGLFLTPSATPVTTTYNYKRWAIKDVDFGETLGIIYHLTNMFAVEGNYYYGFNNIYPNNRRTTEWRTQQITLGLRYAFLTLNKKESK